MSASVVKVIGSEGNTTVFHRQASVYLVCGIFRLVHAFVYIVYDVIYACLRISACVCNIFALRGDKYAMYRHVCYIIEDTPLKVISNTKFPNPIAKNTNEKNRTCTTLNSTHRGVFHWVRGWQPTPPTPNHPKGWPPR